MAETKVGTSGVAGFMLRTAKTHEERGNVHQAIYDYFNIIDRESETKEAKEAYDRLVKMAQNFEEDGQLYAAKHLYMRIEEEVPEETSGIEVNGTRKIPYVSVGHGVMVGHQR